MSLDVELYCEPCPHCGEVKEGFRANITHNLSPMAREAGIYKAVWRPEEIGIEYASQLISTLSAGISKMRANPSKFRALDSPNGWGLYDNFVPWLERYLQACMDHPNAKVETDR